MNFERLHEPHQVSQFVERLASELNQKISKLNNLNEKEKEYFGNITKFMEEYKDTVQKNQDLRRSHRDANIDNLLFATKIETFLKKHQDYLDKAYEIFIDSPLNKTLKKDFAGYYEYFQHSHQSLQEIEKRYRDAYRSSIANGYKDRYQNQNETIVFSYEILNLLQGKYQFLVNDLDQKFDKLSDRKNLSPKQIKELIKNEKEYSLLLAETMERGNEISSLIGRLKEDIREHFFNKNGNASRNGITEKFQNLVKENNLIINNINQINSFSEKIDGSKDGNLTYSSSFIQELVEWSSSYYENFDNSVKEELALIKLYNPNDRFSSTLFFATPEIFPNGEKIVSVVSNTQASIFAPKAFITVEGQQGSDQKIYLTQDSGKYKKNVKFNDSENGYFFYRVENLQTKDHYKIISLNQSVKLDDGKMLNFKLDTNPFSVNASLDLPLTVYSFGRTKIAEGNARVSFDTLGIGLSNNESLGVVQSDDIGLIDLKTRTVKLPANQTDNTVLMVKYKNEAGQAVPTQAYAVTLFSLPK